MLNFLENLLFQTIVKPVTLSYETFDKFQWSIPFSTSIFAILSGNGGVFCGHHLLGVVGYCIVDRIPFPVLFTRNWRREKLLVMDIVPQFVFDFGLAQHIEILFLRRPPAFFGPHSGRRRHPRPHMAVIPISGVILRLLQRDFTLNHAILLDRAIVLLEDASVDLKGLCHNFASPSRCFCNLLGWAHFQKFW